jgi:hypothetical protein
MGAEAYRCPHPTVDSRFYLAIALNYCIIKKKK